MEFKVEFGKRCSNNNQVFAETKSFLEEKFANNEKSRYREDLYLKISNGFTVEVAVSFNGHASYGYAIITNYFPTPKQAESVE